MIPASSLPLAIRRHAAARPLALAIRDAVGDHSFGALDRAADAAATALRASGIAPGDRVALLAAPSGEAIALLGGIARAGAVAVPLGTRLTRREIAAAVAETAPALLVHDADLADVAAGHGVPALAPAALAARATGAPPRSVDVDPDAPAVAILTSGTTGRPKAALLSHRALAASAAAWTAALPPATGWLLCLGLAHVAGLGVAWRALGAGLPLHVAAGFDPEAILAVLHGSRCPEPLLARAGPAGAPPRRRRPGRRGHRRPGHRRPAPPSGPSCSAARRSRRTWSAGRRRPAGPSSRPTASPRRAPASRRSPRTRPPPARAPRGARCPG